MTRPATQAEIWDHARDNRKHAMTQREIAAELTRLEREIRETVARSQTACKEAMRIIEGIADDLGIPLARERTDA